MRSHWFRGFGCFLFGVGSQLQIISSLSFTELFVFLAAPVLFFSEYNHMRRTGILSFFWLSIALVCGGVLSCLVNHTAYVFALRGLATVCLFPCTIVVTHWMLRRNMNGFKWFVLGSAISSVLCVFMFQKAVEVGGMAGADSDDVIEHIVSGPLFWIRRLGPFVMLPSKGWYLQCPMAYNIAAPIFMCVFSLMSSVSGRAVALGAFGGAMMVLIGGKRREGIHNRVCKRFWLFCALGIVGLFVFKGIYSYTASRGYLGDEARKKYERQTLEGSSLGKLIMGGRMTSFVGLLACKDHPIVGLGPWAQDFAGYQKAFLEKYGTSEDYAMYLRREMFMLRRGDFGWNFIPKHSHITQCWLWFGIFGLLFWLYVLFVLLRYLKQDCWMVPQWFMWVAASIPALTWHIFFSPVTSRVSEMMIVVACLLVRAVRKGRQRLPLDMIREIEKVESR